MARKARKKRFTEQGIERLRYDPAMAPPSGRMEIEDEVCPGLVLRVTPRGVKSFSVIYKVPGEGGTSDVGRLLTGKQHRITLGPTPPLDLKTARERTRKIVLAATEGRDARIERNSQNRSRCFNTFDAALNRFIEQEIKPTVRSWKNVERVLRIHVQPHWSNKSLLDIRRSDIHEILDGLVANGRPATGYEVRKHLSRFFNWATDRELLTDNPIHSMKRSDLAPKGDAGRALTDAELRYIWRSACFLGYPFGDLFKLLILTGQRRNEWASARLSEINFNKGWLEIPKARYKGGRDHIVPLAGEVLSIIENLPVCSESHNFILSSRNGEVPVSGFSKAKAMLDGNVLALMKADEQDAKLQKYRVHDFRVTCETRLANLGFNQETRDAVLGHAKLGLQKTYNKYDYSEEKKAALTAYANEIKRIVK